ncbi:MAG: hypothetical protein JST00_38270 [Deltaproteobacteria bacterium]|nr:hypothetical protein [Deltaproteobacteria bacterium]
MSSLALLAACSEQIIVRPGTSNSPDANAEPEVDAGSVTDGGEGPRDAAVAGWPGCKAVDAAFCDDFDGPNGGTWTRRYVGDGGTVQVAGASASSPPKHLRTELPPAGTDRDGYGARIEQDVGGLSLVDYSAEIRIVRRSGGRVMIHEIVTGQGSNFWRLGIELSPSGDRIVEETFDALRATPLSRPLPANAWVNLRINVDIGISGARAIVSLDGKDVAIHKILIPGARPVTLYAGQRALDAEAGGSIVDVDNVVLYIDER